MADQRNIVVVGGGVAGLQATHYTLKHILPTLKAKEDAKYHVYLVSPTSKWYFRVASPRVATSTDRLAFEKTIFDLHEGFKSYSSDDFTLVEGTASGLDAGARRIFFKAPKAAESESLPYHALIIATGSSTYYQAFSMSAASEATLDAVKISNEKVKSAKEIVIVGGGPTAVEFAGEVGEFRNGKPGWFSTPKRKVKITLITAADQLLPQLRPAIGKLAEQRLGTLGVDAIYNSRVTDASEGKNGRTTVTLANGKKYEADLYVPAYGVEPNSSWLPANLLNDKNYVVTNHETLRVDAAGPRVYAVGDVASYSRNSVVDILGSMPVVVTNMKRDLLAYDAAYPDRRPKGKDRLFKADTRENMVVPMGSGTGVGAVMGWKLPAFFIALLKGRDYMLGMSGQPTAGGDNVKKEVKWTAEEAAI